MENPHPYIQHVITAFNNANKNKSKITQAVIDVNGMIGNKIRHFYNNLLELTDARYLEIGCWKGASLCAAMYNNQATITCIDNWSEFGGPRDEFIHNFNLFKGSNNVTLIEQDCFSLNVATLPKFNIYMYDGSHSEDSQYKAITHMYDCLDDVFILVIDDWMWEQTRLPIRKALQDKNLKVLHEIEIIDSSTYEMDAPGWWNGIYIAVLQK